MVSVVPFLFCPSVEMGSESRRVGARVALRLGAWLRQSQDLVRQENFVSDWQICQLR